MFHPHFYNKPANPDVITWLENNAPDPIYRKQVRMVKAADKRRARRTAIRNTLLVVLGIVAAFLSLKVLAWTDAPLRQPDMATMYHEHRVMHADWVGLDTLGGGYLAIEEDF